MTKKENQAIQEYVQTMVSRVSREPENDRPPDFDHDERGDEGGNPDQRGIDPFRILGVADDGLAYFLDQWGRLQKWRLEARAPKS